MADVHLTKFLQTPALWFPDMENAEWKHELDQLFFRALATREFVQGELDPEQFEDALFQFGYDPIFCRQYWEDGRMII